MGGPWLVSTNGDGGVAMQVRRHKSRLRSWNGVVNT